MKLFDEAIELSLLKTIYDGDKSLLNSLKIKDFSRDENKRFFMVFKERNTQPTDNELLNLGFSESFLASIISRTGLIKPLLYAQKLRELSLKRELKACINLASKSLYADDLAKVSNNLLTSIMKLNKEQSEDELKTTPAIICEFNAYSKEMKTREDKDLIGIATGFGGLDRCTRGLKKSELCILAARPAMGKTTLALNIVDNVLNVGKSVLFFSLEMSALQLFQKLISSRLGVPLARLALCNIDQREEEEIKAVCDFYKNKALSVYDKGACSFDVLQATLRRLQAKESLPDLVVLDYLGLMSGEAKKSRYENVSDISRGLKLLALELQVPILCLAQLNRQLEQRNNKRPQLSDLRESGSIEQDADTVLFIHKEEEDESLKLIIAKNRHGECGDVDLGFDKEYSKMYCKKEAVVEFSFK